MRYRNPILLVICLLVAWEFLPDALGIPSYVLPSLSAVGNVFVEKFFFLLRQTLPTLYEIILGFVFSAIAGVGLGIAIGQFKIVQETLYPLLIVINSIPKVALAPLIIIWLGFGMTSIVTIIVLIAFFPILINTIVGIGNVRPEMVELVRTMTPSRTKEFLRVRVPSSIPYIFAGMRTSITLVAVGAVVAEFIVGQAGLGFVILSAQQNLDVAIIFASITLLVVISLALFGALIIIEKKLMPWRKNIEML
jgi:NitT/TauT family transport system permease protein